MTFDFTPEQQALAARAREAATAIGDSVAHVIDTLGSVPEDVSKSLKAQSLKQVFENGVTNALIVIEELATVSAGLAAHIGFESATGSTERKTVIPSALAGLRSSESQLAAVEIGSTDIRAKGRLAAAAVALGVGRAAVAHAVAAMKRNDVKPGPETTVPHWALADGATDVAAARLLTYSAAQSLDRGARSDSVIARALDFAAKAAQSAVDAAIRIEGAAGYTKGGLLERLSRDARTLQVILRA
jgi:alkylation response protein AidB-like acyl-CoA dehydrogenase